MSNDSINVQRGIVGAGSDNDTYILSANLIEANAQITISDVEGDNEIQLIGGLEIVSSIVAGDTAQLTLSNGAVVTVLGASTMSYEVGGNPLDGTPGVTKDYSTFAADVLGTTVPAAGEPNTTGGVSTVNADGTATGGTPVDPNAPTYALAAAAATVDEGEDATFTLTTTNVAESTVVAYTLTGVDAADVDALTGTATVGADGTATITVAVTADATTETAETLTVTIDGQTANASVTVNDTSATPVAGQTFALTTGADVITGTADSDVINASLDAGNATFGGLDSIDGGAGTDTLNVSANTGSAVIASSLAGVEVLNVVSTVANSGVSVVGTTGITNANIVGGSATGVISGMDSTTIDLGVTNATNAATFTFLDEALQGDADSASLTLKNVNGSAITVQTTSAATNGVETLNISTDTANTATITDGAGNSLSTINLSGAGSLDADAAVLDATVTTVNSTLTGAAKVEFSATDAVTFTSAAGADSVKVDLASTGADTITTGAGDDTVTFQGDTLTADDTVTAGEGTDKLVITTATADNTADLTAKVTGFETLAVSDAVGAVATISVANFGSAINKVELDTGTAAAATINTLAGTSTIAVDGGTLSGLLTANAAGTASDDVLNVVFNNTTATANGSNITATDYETVNIDASKANETLGTVTVTPNSSSSTSTINLTGSKTITMDTGDTLEAQVVDASTMTSAVSGNGLVMTTAATLSTGQTLTATDAKDTLFSAGGNDTVNAGGADDTVTSAAGNDTINGGAGDDTLIFTGGSLNKSDTVDGGEGTDTLQMTAANAGTLSAASTADAAAFNAAVSNVEVIHISDALNGTTVDMDDLDGLSKVSLGVAGVANSIDSDTSITDLGADAEITYNDSASAADDTLTATLKTASGTEAVSVVLKDSAGAVNFGELELADVETLNVNSTTTTGGNTTSNTLAFTHANDLETLNIAGAVAFSSVVSSTELATIDASATTGAVDVTATASTAAMTVTGSSAADTFSTGAGNDTINGGNGNDNLSGNSGTDTINGGDGDDTIDGGAGNDIIDGGAGNDSITIGSGTDTIDGGAGTDTIVISNALFNDISGMTVSNVETINMNSNATTMTIAQLAALTTFTNAAAVTLSDAGTVAANTSVTDYTLANGTNTWTASSTAANYTVTGGTGADTFNIDSSTITTDDSILAGAGTDTLNVTGNTAVTNFLDVGYTGLEKIVLANTTTNVTLVSDNANVGAGETLRVDAAGMTSGVLNFTGTAEADGIFELIGGAAADVLIGGAGADTIVGGLGGDTITGGAGIDAITLTESSASADTVVLDQATASNQAVVTGFGATDVISFDESVFASISFANTAAVGALSATDYNEIAAAGTLADDKVNVITTAAGYADYDTAYAAVTAGTGEGFIAFYNSATSKTEIYFDADTSDNAGEVLVAQLDITGANLATSLSEANFAVL